MMLYYFATPNFALQSTCQWRS